MIAVTVIYCHKPQRVSAAWPHWLPIQLTVWSRSLGASQDAGGSESATRTDAGEAARLGPEMSHVLRTCVSPQCPGTEGALGVLFGNWEADLWTLTPSCSSLSCFNSRLFLSWSLPLSDFQRYLEGLRFPGPSCQGEMTGWPFGLNSNQGDATWETPFVAILTKTKANTRLVD